MPAGLRFLPRVADRWAELGTVVSLRTPRRDARADGGVRGFTQERRPQLLSARSELLRRNPPAFSTSPSADPLPFDFNTYEITLHPPQKSIGEDGVWELATRGPWIDALERKGWLYTVDEGGRRPSYGPKIRHQDRRCHRPSLCSVPRPARLHLPEAFRLEYVARRASRQRSDHDSTRSIFGSLERFFSSRSWWRKLRRCLSSFWLALRQDPLGCLSSEWGRLEFAADLQSKPGGPLACAPPRSQAANGRHS